MHAGIAPEFLPRALGELLDRGVELRVDGRARSLAGDLAETHDRGDRARTGRRSSTT